MTARNDTPAMPVPLDPTSEQPAIRTVAMPSDTNPAGDIFGGWLMSQMDLAAGIVATRRAKGRAVTIAADRMTFLQPVLVGDEVSLFARLTQTGRTSMHIFVEAWRRPREGGELVKVTQATFTYVAVDSARKSRPLPDRD